MTNLERRLPYVLVMATVLVVDQLVKWLVVRSLELHDYRSIVDGVLSLEFWRGDPGRGSLFGGALSTSQVIAIAVYAWRLPATARLPQSALALILGGAFGNLVDRIRLGYVVDFVHVYWRDHQWPDFNVADSAITIGVTLLVLDILRTPHVESPGKAELEAASPAGRIE